VRWNLKEAGSTYGYRQMQGGNLSPLLANIMLNELDKEMEARGLDFVRQE